MNLWGVIMKKIRFFLALWAGKLLLFVWKRIGRERDDKPGMASMRLCEDFLELVAKPKLTIAVTGTNGKTSISSMVADMLRRRGMITTGVLIITQVKQDAFLIL